MKRHLRTWKDLLVLGALAILALSGCGSDEYNPSPASQKKPVDESTRPLFVDPFESGVVAIQLDASSEFDTATGNAKIFALVKDQSGDSLIDFSFNEYNFAVTLFPASVPRGIDPADTALRREVSSDNLVALVIDSSGSMDGLTETGQTRMAAAREAAKLFVSLMGPGDRTAVVDFDDDARTVQALTADQDALNAAIDTFVASGATNLGAALGEAVRAVGNRPGKRAAILLTDGDDTVDPVSGGPDVWLNDPQSSRFQALQLAQDSGLIVYTVGLGSGLSDTGLADLQTIAAETGGEFFDAPTAASLLTVFSTTIPDQLDALAPVETFLLEFPNPVQARPGQTVDVSFRASIFYENANGQHFDKSSGVYTVP